MASDHKRYDPVGRCIYCDATAGLSKEHIIPHGLNGNLILPDASCPACREETHAYEGHCQAHMYGRVRDRLGLRSRRRKERPTSYTFRLGRGSKGETLDISVVEMPVWLIGFDFDPPEFLVGMSPTKEFLGARPAVRDAFPESTNKALAVGRGRVSTRMKLEPIKLIQMLAKIGHAFATAEFGHGNFSPFLIDIILNKSLDYPHYYVGSQVMLDPDSAHLHEIGWRIQEVRGCAIIVIKIRLFALWGMPTYFVVAGELPLKGL